MYFLHLTFCQTKGKKMHIADVLIINAQESAQILLKMATAKNKTTANEVKLTAAQKVQLTINTLGSKNVSELTAYELQRLQSALRKQEQKSLRFVYATLKREYESNSTAVERLTFELAGKKFPTFSAFSKAYKSKYVSLWGGGMALKALNPKHQLSAKVKRQNKAEAKK